MAGQVIVIGHPLVQHKLTLMRNKDTSTSTFRNLLREISMLLGYEVCRDFPTTMIPIETPVAPTMAKGPSAQVNLRSAEPTFGFATTRAKRFSAST